MKESEYYKLQDLLRKFLFYYGVQMSFDDFCLVSKTSKIVQEKVRPSEKPKELKE